MTNTDTDTATSTDTIETTAFLDAFRALADFDWCDQAEIALENYLSVETRILSGNCSCGDSRCPLGAFRRTEPRFSYVSGPKTLDVKVLKAALREEVARGQLKVQDAVTLAEAVGIKDLYMPQTKYAVTFTLSGDPGVSWDGSPSSSSPSRYDLARALRYDGDRVGGELTGRVSDLTVTKVIEGETV